MPYSHYLILHDIGIHFILQVRKLALKTEYIFGTRNSVGKMLSSVRTVRIKAWMGEGKEQTPHRLIWLEDELGQGK